jgi:hypothetical protein
MEEKNEKIKETLLSVYGFVSSWVSCAFQLCSGLVKRRHDNKCLTHIFFIIKKGNFMLKTEKKFTNFPNFLNLL